MGLGSWCLSESLNIGVHMVIEDREAIDTMELKGVLCFDKNRDRPGCKIGLGFHVGIVGGILKEGNDESIHPIDVVGMAIESLKNL